MTTDTITPQQIIERHGLKFIWYPKGRSEMTTGERYRVNVSNGTDSAVFDFHSSEWAERNGTARDGAELVLCLLSESGAYLPDTWEMADRLYDDGTEGKPSELLALARKIQDNYWNLALLVGDRHILDGYLDRWSE